MAAIVGKCPICRKTKRLVADHCHKMDEWRDRICGTCNTGLGMFHDDPTTMRRAARYIDQWRKTFANDDLLGYGRTLPKPTIRELIDNMRARRS